MKGFQALVLIGTLMLVACSCSAARIFVEENRATRHMKFKNGLSPTEKPKLPPLPTLPPNPELTLPPQPKLPSFGKKCPPPSPVYESPPYSPSPVYTSPPYSSSHAITLNCESLSTGVNNASCFVDKPWMCPEC
uniref:Uncharacterized protein n=1 Tax=Physcomitrium patens TaxID=3218 RepID=A0A2K1L2C1_PHYPA|nr:hypothetical protein PHYPA_002968 [Physcomitrium patens]